MAISIFDFTANKTISETHSFFGDGILGYVDQTATHPCRAWFSGTFDDEMYDHHRGLLQFNTSTIPIADTITKVEVYQKFSETPTPTIAPLGGGGGYESVFVGRYCLLNTNLTLAANLATWDAGTLCLQTSNETDGIWLDLGASAPALINRTGTTTLNYRRADCDGINSTSFALYTQIGSSKLSVSGTPVQLRITHGPAGGGRKVWPMIAMG